MSQAGDVKTTNRRDRGCTAGEKHGLRQPFLLMELVRGGSAIGLKTDHDADRHPDETHNQATNSKHFTAVIQRISSFCPPGREERKTATPGDGRP